MSAWALRKPSGSGSAIGASRSRTSFTAFWICQLATVLEAG